MKKIIVAFMMVMVFMVTGNVASAHTSIYTNPEIVEDSEDCSSVSWIVFDHDGFRAELNVTSADTNDVQYQKEFDFGYAIGYYVSSNWLNEVDHPMYVMQIRDGVIYQLSVGTAQELMYELSGVDISKKTETM